MPKLDDEVKTFIVTSLAMYDSPTAVAKEVEKRFGIQIDRTHVRKYNPDHTPKVGEKWKAIFTTTRANYIAGKVEVPIALRMHRLRTLNRVSDRAEATGNLAIVLAATEQAAKEVGDVFTNRQKVEHSDPNGNPFVAGVTVFIEGKPAIPAASVATAPAPPTDAQPHTP